MTSSSIAMPSSMPSRRLPRLNFYWAMVLPLGLLLAVLYAYPLVMVAWISVSDPEIGLQNYERLLTNAGIHRMLWTTLQVCVITSVLSMLAGYIIAYAMVHAGDRHRSWMLIFLLVPFWVSVLARAFSWVALLHDGGLINSWLMDLGITSEPLTLVRNRFGAILGMVHYMIPYAVLPLYANMRNIDPKLVAAARGLGAGPLESFLRVFLPLSMPGIAAGGVLVFILTLGFFVTPTILGGGKTMMIAEYVSVQILDTIRWGIGSMLAMVLLALVLIVFAVMSRIVDFKTLFGAK
jgi:putative spermidine/putrescine transport system permease protein